MAKKNYSLTATLVRIPKCGHRETRTKAQDAIDYFFSGDDRQLAKAVDELQSGKVEADQTDGPD